MSKRRVPFPKRLMREWDYRKNGELSPSDFTGGSDQKIWWKCELGHSWLTAIKYRTIGTNCPFCAGKKVWVGFNDLRTTHPKLADEWDFHKNGASKPEDYTGASNKSAWWKCWRGHSWLAMINNRGKGQRCPYCAGVKVLIGFNDLPTTNPVLSKEWCYEKNGKLRPEQFSDGSNKKVWWKCDLGHTWKAAIYSRKAHGCPQCYGKNTFVSGVNDLATVNPGLSKEWDYEKNAGLRPESVSGNAHMKAWWKCKKGHSWRALISNRNFGNSCPFCTNRIVLRGFNDLLHLDSQLCEEWDYEKNSPLLPDAVLANSSKQVWWECEQGHSWKAAICYRRRGSGCPVCANRVVIAGYNDLKTLRPDIADQWNYEKNGDLFPDQVTVQATHKVWWLCPEGHSYVARVYNRFNGTDCPYCAGSIPIIGENDLVTLHPKLLKEWDYERNSRKKPEEYTCGSNQKVWWKCIRGHHWMATIVSRTVNGGTCPYCKGKFPMRSRLVK